MMAYADGFQGDSIIGVAYAVGSASTSALYKVGHNYLLVVLHCLTLDIKNARVQSESL